MTSSIADQWLGKGLGFPIRPDPVTGRLPAVEGMALVRQAIGQILDTEPGERIMRPAFGCGLRRFLMEPNTLATRSAMEKDIEAALDRWEPRIQLTKVAVTADKDPSLVWIEISYIRRSDRRPDNLVYPFYLR
jgi:phage baseplate assembly protein W